MNIHTLLDRWLSRGVITEKQYTTMVADVKTEE